MAEKKYSFKSAHFYKLLESQGYSCFFSKRPLVPNSTMAVHVIPLQLGGKHEISNIVLVDKEIHHIKKYVTPDKLLKLAKDIVEANGYRLVKSKKKK
jgi:5-methylcytosine-specific restriction endonuclease McrA